MNRLVQHGQGSRLIPLDQDLYIDGAWEVYQIDENYAMAREGYEVNAWFQDD